MKKSIWRNGKSRPEGPDDQGISLFVLNDSYFYNHHQTLIAMKRHFFSSLLALMAFVPFLSDTENLSRAQTPVSFTPDRENHCFVLVIDDVVQIQGIGTMAMGSVYQGSVSVGDAIKIAGYQKGSGETICTSISKARQYVTTAQTGDLVAIALRGIPRENIKRGMVLVHRR